MMGIMASVLAMVGAFLQGRLALQTLRSVENDAVRTFATVDDLYREVSWWRPWQRRRHRRLVRQLLSSSASEAAAYRRIKANLTGWVVLWAGAVIAIGASLEAAWPHLI